MVGSKVWGLHTASSTEGELLGQELGDEEQQDDLAGAIPHQPWCLFYRYGIEAAEYEGAS
jgi:hypothetical protein